MDIFEFALEKERYAEHFYRDLAGRTNHKGLANILTMLAEEESKHYDAIAQMKANEPAEVGDAPTFASARDMFEKMKRGAERFNFEITEADLYRKAAEIERKSKEFYREKAGEMEDPNHQRIFEQLAEEEVKHELLMESFVNFVSRPETYLESAEFYHFDDYIGGQF